MTVSLVQWRALVGIFDCWISGTLTNNRYNLIRKFVSMIKNLLLCYHCLEGVYATIIALLYIFVLLLFHGDIEPKPGPKNFKKITCLSAIGSLSAHNFPKLTQMKAYISMYKHNFICLSETYLDSSTPDSLLEIDGCNLVRADYPNNIKEVDFAFTTRSHSLFDS